MDAGEMALGGGALAAIALIVVSSLAMVVSMVRFSRAFLGRVEERARRRPGDAPEAAAATDAIRRLGALYALVWLVLIAALLVLLIQLEDGGSRRNLALLALVVGAYWTVHALLLWFAAALIRANLRGAGPRGKRGTPPSPGSRAYGGGWSDDVGPAPAPVVPSAPVPTLGDRARSLARTLATVAAALGVVAVGAAVPALQELEAWFDLRRGILAPAVGAVAGLGWALLVGGAIHGVLTAGAYGSFSDAMPFAEVKAAVRARAWRVSRRWRRFAVMALGAALMTVGLFGLGIVLAPAGVKLLCAAALGYAAVQIARGFRRA